jgi:hypothetical protein
MYTVIGSSITPLREVLPPAQRPEGFSHGVPTEILEKRLKRDLSEIVFAQRFPNWEKERELIAIATPAGMDQSGRVVHLGLLLLLRKGEPASFVVSLEGLCEEDRRYASVLLQRLSVDEPGDEWARSVRELLQADPALGPATNVELARAATRFASLYRLGPRRLVRKERRRVAFDLLVLLMLVLALFYMRQQSCGHRLGAGAAIPTAGRTDDRARG